jgi:hypothetical protein
MSAPFSRIIITNEVTFVSFYNDVFPTSFSLVTQTHLLVSFTSFPVSDHISPPHNRILSTVPKLRRESTEKQRENEGGKQVKKEENKRERMGRK